MGDVPLVALLVAVLGTGGVTALITSILQSISKARAGVAVREDKRRDDIVRARDEAVAAATAARIAEDLADARADAERLNRIRWMEHAARQRVKLINAGIEPDNMPGEHTEPPSP